MKRQREDELAEAIVLATFPALGDPDDIPLTEFGRYVTRACQFWRWRNGGAEEQDLEDRMLEVLRRR